jgi:alpha-beta hydrolase superfamily lysophospholipase
MNAPHPRVPGRGFLPAVLVASALSALLTGCAVSGRVVPAPELASSGWNDPAALAPVADFDAYVRGVTEELRSHRLPFDPSMADAELGLVAPFRVPPGPACQAGERRGIAVLVHGLSDSAFAMRDLAASLARQCFESRVLLLPGHGTRPADLMVVDHEDWLGHVQAAVSQAARESDFVVMAGFSLGAALALTVAADSPGKVDAVIGLSPAYRIRSTLLARQARWIAAFRPWLNAGTQVEFARYAAMPTLGIASTMATLGRMDARVDGRGALRVPWLVVQSEDDEVVDVAGNRRFFTANAGDARSVLLNYFSAAPTPTPTPASGDRVVWLPAADAPLRVVGLSHLSVHIAPDNPHYGVTGSYRNCGSVPFRQEDEIRACRQAERVWYGVSGQSPPAGEAGARATFNPHYADLERRIGRFLDTVDPRREDRVVSQ